MAEDFYKRWGWYATINELSDNPLVRDYWWKAPYLETLNELAFRKEKNYVESARAGKRNL